MSLSAAWMDPSVSIAHEDTKTPRTTRTPSPKSLRVFVPSWLTRSVTLVGFSEARNNQTRPPNEKRETADRRDRAERGGAGQRQEIEAARKQHDADGERPAGRTDQRPAHRRHHQPDQQQRQRVVHVVSNGRFENRQHVWREPAAQSMCAERAERDTEEREQRAHEQKRLVHAFDCSGKSDEKLPVLRPRMCDNSRRMLQRLRVPAAACTLVFVQLASAARAADSPKTGEAPITEITATWLSEGSPVPILDGRVTDEAWLRVEPYSTFTQTDPNEGEPATERTEVRVLFDKTNVYIGVICFDSEPAKVIVNQSRRDADLTETDAIILVLDTFNDNQNAFVFGTNPLGIEYDGQVSGEGQTSGTSNNQQSGTGGSQRGTIGSLNLNWDGDWRVKSTVTERGWETEIAIPFKTLRYAPGEGKTWGLNLKRNIRRKNEQVYLAPVQRGFDVFRVSSAAKLTGLDLPPRRDLKFTPYALASVNKDYAVQTHQVTRRANPFEDRNIGFDTKWGIKPNLTADFTVNTDFAQVEADEEQVNLTRFDLFFPEKRGFFLENASVFQFGSPQNIDLFFSRRIGLSATGSSGVPIDILGGARLSGKVGGYNVGLLNMQTDDAHDVRTGRVLTSANNFGVVRVIREIGRSNFGGIFVNREGTGSLAGRNNFNRAYGVDANIQLTKNGKLFAFLARTNSPATGADRAPHGADHSGRIFYNFTNNIWQISGGYSQVGNNFNPEVGYLPRRGYRRPEFRMFFQPQPKRWPWIRRISPHVSYNAFYGLNDVLV